VGEIRGHNGQPVHCCKFTKDGAWLVTASGDSTLKKWDIKSQQLDGTFEGHKGDVHECDISGDGTKLVSGGKDNVLAIWDMVTQHRLQSCERHTSWITAVQYSPDSSFIASASKDKSVLIWDSTTGQVKLSLIDKTAVSTARISPDSNLIATGAEDTVIKIWDLKTGKTVTTLKGHPQPVTSLSWAKNSKNIVTVSLEYICMFDVTSAKKKWNFSDRIPMYDHHYG